MDSWLWERKVHKSWGHTAQWIVTIWTRPCTSTQAKKQSILITRTTLPCPLHAFLPQSKWYLLYFCLFVFKYLDYLSFKKFLSQALVRKSLNPCCLRFPWWSARFLHCVWGLTVAGRGESAVMGNMNRSSSPFHVLGSHSALSFCCLLLQHGHRWTPDLLPLRLVAKL